MAQLQASSNEAKGQHRAILDYGATIHLGAALNHTAPSDERGCANSRASAKVRGSHDAGATLDARASSGPNSGTNFAAIGDNLIAPEKSIAGERAKVMQIAQSVQISREAVLGIVHGDASEMIAAEFRGIVAPGSVDAENSQWPGVIADAGDA